MTTYVDHYNGKGFAGRLFADTRKQLDEMADELGMDTGLRQRTGSPFEHYDLTDWQHKMARDLGAKLVRNDGLARLARLKAEHRSKGIQATRPPLYTVRLVADDGKARDLAYDHLGGALSVIEAGLIGGSLGDPDIGMEGLAHITLWERGERVAGWQVQ